MGLHEASAPERPVPASRVVEGSGADLLVESLHEAGVEVIFGVPGDTGVDLYEALAARGSPRHVLTNDERSAVFAADAYSRASNSVGVAEVSSGGGVTYAVGGLGEAYAASTPILLIASDISRGSRGTGALTELDQVGLFQAVTKAQFVADRADAIPGLVQRAFSLLRTGRPAPVVLIVPEDVLHEHATATVRPTVAEQATSADPLAIVRVAAAIDDARAPAIVVGGGLFLARGLTELKLLADRAGCAVATTIHGKGSFPEQHPLSLGVVGANGGLSSGNAFLASEADFVLFVGTRANSTDTNGFTAPPRQGTLKVAHCDIDASRAGHNYPGSIALVGDAKVVLDALSATTRANPARRSGVIRRIRDRRSTELEPQRLAPEGTIDPQAAVMAIQAQVGTEVTVVADCGTPTPYLAAYWQLPDSGRRLICPRGHGPMGFAIPGAIGASFARRGEAILAFTTDGSLLMSAGALEGISRLELPIVIVQFTNNSLGWIKTLQQIYFKGRHFATTLSPFDGPAVAAAFGIRSTTVADGRALGEVVRESLLSMKPAFIDVRVPDEYELLPPVAPWLAAAAEGGERPVY